MEIALAVIEPLTADKLFFMQAVTCVADAGFRGYIIGRLEDAAQVLVVVSQPGAGNFHGNIVMQIKDLRALSKGEK